MSTNNYALFVIAALAVVLVAAAAVYVWFAPGAAGRPRACTDEAKLCPDGTAVGRTGPNCEFAPCPSAAATGTLTGTVQAL